PLLRSSGSPFSPYRNLHRINCNAFLLQNAIKRLRLSSMRQALPNLTSNQSEPCSLTGVLGRRLGRSKTAVVPSRFSSCPQSSRRVVFAGVHFSDWALQDLNLRP